MQKREAGVGFRREVAVGRGDEDAAPADAPELRQEGLLAFAAAYVLNDRVGIAQVQRRPEGREAARALSAHTSDLDSVQAKGFGDPSLPQ